MASSVQSNPVYYSLASQSSGQQSSSRTVVLRKRPDHDGFGVYIGEDIPTGLYVVTVERNSPASDANIQPGDRVLAVNGKLVSSMSTNPKEMLIKAATNAENLTLTIQSTDIFEILNMPSTNSYTTNNDHQSKKRNSSRQTLAINTDLENYIKSLFANENVQILQTSNNNEFILKSDPYATSSMDFNSFPNRYHQSTNHRKHHHHHHHHHRHRHSQRTGQVTKQTQTSFDDEQNENISQEQLQSSSSRQYPTYPSMGTSQRVLRTQQQTSNDNPTQESLAPKPSLTNRNSEFTAIPPSPPPNNVTRNSTENNNPPTRHMVDIVEAAMVASQNQKQPNNREQISSREPAPVTKQTTAPQPSRQPPENRFREPVPATKQTATPPLSRQPPENRSREPVPATKQTATPPLSRQPPENRSREPANTTKRTTMPPPSRQPPENRSREPATVTRQTATPPPPPPPPPQKPRSPPPYTETAVTYTSSEPVNNRDNVNQGSYNVRNAEQSLQTTSSIRGDGLREVDLHRLPDFQGFGFHLQYNKMYYLVQRIEPDSPAERAGLRPNDVILSINQQDTLTMPHGIFVETVNANADVHLLVQVVEEYLRANPLPQRNQQATTALTAAVNNDGDKRKTGLSKALSKLTSR